VTGAGQIERIAAHRPERAILGPKSMDVKEVAAVGVLVPHLEEGRS